MSILVFDSGVGGLSVFREARVKLPDWQFVYLGDNAGFPYGEWDEQALTAHIVSLFERWIERFQPALAIIACNTASTLIMPALRAAFDIPFVGIVPAIKPAAEQTSSKHFSVLATPGTVKRQSLKRLIDEFANHCHVNLVGATRLARMSEDYMHGKTIDMELLKAEIAPCFVQSDSGRTDIVTLGCTHYPFLINQMRKVAPWPVDWLDPAEAVARRAQDLLSNHQADYAAGRKRRSVAVMTSSTEHPATVRLLESYGLERISELD
ncbi:MAG: glutamate racemase [Granulosicoccus sp.]|nr:glutamate racemase [Granulosicoccus sp.]